MSLNESDSLIEHVDLGLLSEMPTLYLDDMLIKLHDCSASLCTKYLNNGMAELHATRTQARFDALGLTKDDGAACTACQVCKSSYQCQPCHLGDLSRGDEVVLRCASSCYSTAS